MSINSSVLKRSSSFSKMDDTSYQYKETTSLVKVPNEKGYTGTSFWEPYKNIPRTFFRKAVIVSSADDGQPSLKKCLNLWEILSYGVASTVGSGIYVTVGVVAAQRAGPGIVLSFVFASLVALLSSFCYSEFAARIPVSGSAYSFAYVTLGELVGWIIGWNLTLEYAISASAVARGWGGYLVNAIHVIFGYEMPIWVNAYPLNSFFIISPLSAVIVLACTGLLLTGMKESARFNIGITVFNISIILFIIILGSFYVNRENWSPFLPFGMSGVLAGTGTVFFSYIGFDSVSTLAGEVANPKRDLPLGIVGTLLVATALYVGVCLVFTATLKILETSPLSYAFEQHGIRWAASVIAIGSVTTLSATILVSLIGQPRIFFQMSQDGLLFKLFGIVNRNQVPSWGTSLSGLFAAVLATLLSLDALVDMISIGTLLAFTVVCGGTVILRASGNTMQEKLAGRPSKLHFFAPKYIPVALIIHFCGSVAIAFGAKYGLAWWEVLLLSIPSIFAFAYTQIMFLILYALKAINTPDTFLCPLLPFTPFLGMFTNIYLICQLNIDSIYRVLIWTFLGLLIYFFYGIRNSNLNHPAHKLHEDPPINTEL